MKLTFEQKKKIYLEHKKGYPSKYLAVKYNPNRSTIQYICRFADKQGVKALKHGWCNYSPEFKKEAIERVLIL